MTRYSTGDVWTDAKLLQADELATEARVLAARRALLRESRPWRGGVRAWLGAVVLATGHRLLGSLAGLDREARNPGRGSTGRSHPACPVCRSAGLEASSPRSRPG